ncbi:MAG: hypothetical protein Q9M20_07325 [Mariprofundaceae bacterium]|nr:hypothetical protein [Mariprofundaceae bacterium]
MANNTRLGEAGNAAACAVCALALIKLKRNMEMGYIDKDLLKEGILSGNADLRLLLASVDKNMVEEDILKDAEPAFQPFTCTYEPRVDESYKNMEEADKELMRDLHDSIKSNKMTVRHALKQLKKLKKKYPNVATIYNFIGAAHHALGQNMRHHYMIKQTCKKFPNYLFGKIALAEYRLLHHQHEDIPEIFDHKLQLYMHYPELGENPIFHGAEVKSFYTMVGSYYARNAQLARALKCYFLVEKENPESSVLDVFIKEIFVAYTVSFLSEAVKEMAKENAPNE